jgi:hypothetical protein
MMDVPANEKCSFLFHQIVNYGKKSFIAMTPDDPTNFDLTLKLKFC